MNDEELAKTSTDPTSAEACDPLQTPLEEATVKRGEEAAEALPEESDDNDAALPANPVPHSDPDPVPSFATDPRDDIGELRNELKLLREKMAARDAFFERIGKDCEDFFALYPEKTLSALPDSVWEDVRKGVPIAAATALYERKQKLLEARASASNLDNSRRSSGSLEATEPDFFTPAEVRAMSASEVRTNYQKIMRSMKAWR